MPHVARVDDQIRSVERMQSLGAKQPVRVGDDPDNSVWFTGHQYRLALHGSRQRRNRRKH